MLNAHFAHIRTLDVKAGNFLDEKKTAWTRKYQVRKWVLTSLLLTRGKHLFGIVDLNFVIVSVEVEEISTTTVVMSAFVVIFIHRNPLILGTRPSSNS